jgi:Protein of unknown function (DUF3151)
MSDRPVTFSTGLPQTILDDEPSESLLALREAMAIENLEQRRDAISSVVARWPRFLDGWAQLGRLGRDPIERYAAHRVGYHRGLDRLRASGWRGSGYVRWEHQANRGFLRAMEGLYSAAAEINETDEAERCKLFLYQLDPNWDRRVDPD